MSAKGLETPKVVVGKDGKEMVLISAGEFLGGNIGQTAQRINCHGMA